MSTQSPTASTSECLRNEAEEKRREFGDCVPLWHQVAGHRYGANNVGMLQHPDGTILKQLQPPPRGRRELQFYKTVYAEDCHDPHLLDLQLFLPRYYGTWSSPDALDGLYLKLEDITRQFHKPCIMDVKVGQRSYDPFASREKQAQQVNKYPLMEQIGFLLLGMRVYQVNSDTYHTCDQRYGRTLVKDTVKAGLAQFFYNGCTLRKDALAASIEKVQRILEWFEGQSQLHFYASSLLFVYEGSVQTTTSNHRDQERKSGVQVTGTNCPPNTHDRHTRISTRSASADGYQGDLLYQELESNPGSSSVEVRMIDFAHVFDSQGHDESYIYGLKNLLWWLQQILLE